MQVTASGLIIPSSIADRQPPAFVCVPCGAEFTRDQAAVYQRHVVHCASEHEAELRAESERQKMRGVFGDEGWDIEQERWIRDNAQAILEGRLKP